jgi:hypothetical protein
VHCSQHCFSHGLRAAWDILAILRSAPDLDWDRIARWVRGMQAPRGFWVPVAVLSRELGLPIPSELLREVPRDALQRNLETVAARRLFRVAERVDELDAITRTGMMLLLHDSIAARARYLGTVSRWAVRRPGRKPAPAGGSHPRVGGVRQAWRHFRQYRRAVSRAAADED